ncbi:MAG: PHP domain-containing protein [Methanomicrobiaceae archaeon]|nr:PHP domain-containing protein [Methanomicrobiaceae archaeon]
MLKCDLHIHTSFSRDGESTVEEVLAQAARVGLDAVAITDHDTVEGARYALTLETPVTVIPGIEVSTRQGHLIVLGVLDPVPPGRDFAETVRIAREMGGVLILPHPYHQWRHGVALKVSSAISLVDAVEAFNSRYITGSANRRAAREARLANVPCVGGSDAHNARFVGFGLTLVDAEGTGADAVLAAIRAGKTYAGGHMTPLRTYTRQSLKGAVRKIRKRVHL